MFPEKVCLVVKITRETSYEYEVPLKEWFKNFYPDFFIYDFDNFSEAMVVDYALQLLNNAQQVVLILQAEPESPLGGILKLMPIVMRQKQKTKLVFEGEHIAVERMLKPLGNVALSVDDDTLRGVMESIKNVSE